MPWLLLALVVIVLALVAGAVLVLTAGPSTRTDTDLFGNPVRR